VFQTYPRGVEAPRGRTGRAPDGAFQTYPRGVEASGTSDSAWSKREFQTYPRGVEARRDLNDDSIRLSFRRTLVGLKQSQCGTRSKPTKFQTYPRGVEAISMGQVGRRDHEFQTYPRGVEAVRQRNRRRQPRPVSDVPSWG